MFYRKVDYFLKCNFVRRFSQTSPIHSFAHEKAAKLRAQSLRHLPKVLAPNHKSTKFYTKKEAKVDKNYEETDKWDEKHEIMGKRRSTNFVDTLPVILRGGRGGAGAAGGKGGVGGMGGDIVLKGDKDLSLRMFRDLLQSSSLKRAKVDKSYKIEDAEYRVQGNTDLGSFRY
jgi:hypothetical protein